MFVFKNIEEHLRYLYKNCISCKVETPLPPIISSIKFLEADKNSIRRTINDSLDVSFCQKGIRSLKRMIYRCFLQLMWAACQRVIITIRILYKIYDFLLVRKKKKHRVKYASTSITSWFFMRLLFLYCPHCIFYAIVVFRLKERRSDPSLAEGSPTNLTWQQQLDGKRNWSLMMLPLLPTAANSR